jgi:hypothetical protein
VSSLRALAPETLEARPGRAWAVASWLLALGGVAFLLAAPGPRPLEWAASLAVVLLLAVGGWSQWRRRIVVGPAGVEQRGFQAWALPWRAIDRVEPSPRGMRLVLRVASVNQPSVELGRTRVMLWRSGFSRRDWRLIAQRVGQMHARQRAEGGGT